MNAELFYTENGEEKTIPFSGCCYADIDDQAAQFAKRNSLTVHENEMYIKVKSVLLLNNRGIR